MLQYPITYGHHNFAFNEHLDPDGAIDKNDLRDTVLLDERDPEPMFRDLRDPYHLAQGGSLGSVHKGLFVLPLRGRIEVPNASQQGTMGDRERAMRAAFDPYLCYVDSPATDGVYPLDFQEDTAITATYPTGRIPLRYYMRPAAQPRISELLTDRSWKPFRLALIAGDPRQYEQTEQTLGLVTGGVYTPGSTLNRGTTAAPLKVTITVAAGGGAANFTITRLGVSFVLNLTRYTAGGDVVTVLMETSGPYGIGKSVIRNFGAYSDFDAKTSGPGTWLDVPPGTTPFVLANTSNVSACTLAWYSARA